MNTELVSRGRDADATALTVAICTHNRSAYLAKALASLTSQTAPADRFDVLVVDNASSDDTRQVVERWRGRVPKLRYVREDRLGLSHARNRALAETTSRYIAYLDDDAIACDHWVECLLQAFSAGEPAPAAVGGPIHPIWEAPRPPWLPDTLLGILTVLPEGGVSRTFDLREDAIFGANMAFDTATLRDIGGFDPALGRIGDKLLSGEEILVFRQLRERGAHGYFHAGAAVQHHVAANRLTKSWLYSRVHWGGLSYGVLGARLSGMTSAQRLWTAIKVIRSHLYRGRPWQALPFLGDDESRFAARCRSLNAVSVALGYLRDPVRR